MPPLTKLGRKLKGKFIKEYGKKKGLKIFYSWEKKNPDVKINHSYSKEFKNGI